MIGLTMRPQSCAMVKRRTRMRAGLLIHFHLGQRAAIRIGHVVDDDLLRRFKAR